MNTFAPIDQSFTVSYNYKLFFTEGLFSIDNPLFSGILATYTSEGATKVLFVIDEGVSQKHPQLQDQIVAYCANYKKIIQFQGSILVPGGEQCKNGSEQVDAVLKAIEQKRICRHSFVIAIGGGAVIDMVGYAAAIAHRGVKLIRIPTTVLSQNDSAVGVKNSVNAFHKKNFLGTFAPPYAIINDLCFLSTLSQRDWISGISEAVKVALIKDSTFYEFIKSKATLLRKREMEPMHYVIYKCAQLHMEHIALGGDPFESGSSRPLDFGHWAAHKLEYMTNYELRHGEAVAIGMAIDITYAYLIGLITEKTHKGILEVMMSLGFNLHIPLATDAEIDQLLKGIEEFREHLGGQLTITLISGIGIKKDVHEIDESLMRKAIAMVGSLNSVKAV
ncbi:3-dehydroquinate synthase [Arenibacter sp. GZD96]|uniref:3-dehydroquinate synthase n=1 Tax=Aurantibrevibacter litoralis TaxID=3106030 RepID=UPI002AFFAFC9|nr:3-dehydroquinate synthase [Arenibacter sp. GZD-96]MEA1785995.1 3-dehydroquinate synthase [Arenibacter sp. GZD-96]